MLSHLSEVPLLAGLSEAALGALARVSTLRRVPRGYLIFSQGDAGTAAYIVRSGVVLILVETPEGRELVINDMRPGDCFGEMALLTNAPRSAAAVAGEPTELIVIPREPFLSELAARPALLRRVVEVLCARLASSSARESALAFQEMPARLAASLSELEQRTGGKGYVTISQAELAERIGSTRQTVAEILSDWRRKGWILTGRGRIVLLDRAALRRTANRQK